MTFHKRSFWKSWAERITRLHGVRFLQLHYVLRTSAPWLHPYGKSTVIKLAGKELINDTIIDISTWVIYLIYHHRPFPWIWYYKKKLMLGVVIALIGSPHINNLFWVWSNHSNSNSCYFLFLFEYLIQRFMFRKPVTITDGSALVTGLLLAFNVPSNLPVFIVVIEVLFQLQLRNDIWRSCKILSIPHLSAVYLCWSLSCSDDKLACSFRFRYGYADAVTGATPLAIIKEGIKNGESISDLVTQIPTPAQMFLGKWGASLGEVAAIGTSDRFHLLLLRK